MDKPLSYYAFEVLYWCGVRMGELLALTPADFDFERKLLTINKSYQRIKGQDVITTPKTKKSNRTIKLPQFLCDEIQDYGRFFQRILGSSRSIRLSQTMSCICWIIRIFVVSQLLAPETCPLSERLRCDGENKFVFYTKDYS